MNKLPWNDWYHVTVHVYGSWLRGDPRGWRSRHHREHVDGDYKKPPPKGEFDDLHKLSKLLMTRNPIHIRQDLRRFVVDKIVEKLQQDEIEVAVASVDGKHLHVLARFPDHNVRHWVGRAKKSASHSLRQQGLQSEPGGLWAKRCHAEPIASYQHYLNSLRYIADHATQGAAVWKGADTSSTPPILKAHG